MTFTEDWYPAGQLADLVELATESRNVSGMSVEIGCWEGRSTIAIAQAVAPAYLCAVDTWAGNVDEGPDHGTVRALAQRDVYATFLANIAPYPNIAHRRMDGAVFLAGVEPGQIAFLHLDAGHTYAATRQLIELAIPRMADGGIMCGDDFVNANAGRADLDGGVERAVRETLAGRFETRGNLWLAYCR